MSSCYHVGVGLERGPRAWVSHATPSPGTRTHAHVCGGKGSPRRRRTGRCVRSSPCSFTMGQTAEKTQKINIQKTKHQVSFVPTATLSVVCFASGFAVARPAASLPSRRDDDVTAKMARRAMTRFGVCAGGVTKNTGQKKGKTKAKMPSFFTHGRREWEKVKKGRKKKPIPRMVSKLFSDCFSHEHFPPKNSWLRFCLFRLLRPF